MFVIGKMMENKYLLLAIKSAVKAGEEILKIYNNPSSDFGIERKADHSPLTIADKKAHETILSYLVNTPFPVLSEEGKMTAYEKRKEWQTLWIVDPLDGTKEFIKKNGEFTVNIALVNGQIPVSGVIYIPVKEELYFADEKVGAYKLTEVKEIEPEETLDMLINRAQRLPIPVKTLGREYVIVASRSHLTPETEKYIEQVKRKYPSVKLISSGSSIKICAVAEGAADVYPRFAPTMEWDTAAGHAIARAAGVEIYRADNGLPLLYNKFDLLNPWFIVEKTATKNC